MQAIQALYSVLKNYDPEEDDMAHIALLDALVEVSGESAKVHVTKENGFYIYELTHKNHVIMSADGIDGLYIPHGWYGLNLAEGSLPLPE